MSHIFQSSDYDCMFNTVSLLSLLRDTELSIVLYGAICVKDFISCSGNAGVQYLETYAKLIQKNVNM
jgi:hypothetical protein